MTTKEIQKAIGKACVLDGHPFVCENIRHLSGFSEMDVCSISKTGMIHQYEVKVSRADFNAQKRKQHFKDLLYFLDPQFKTLRSVNETVTHLRHPNYFSFVCTNGLIKLEEIHEKFGLFYAYENNGVQRIEMVQYPKRLHLKKLELFKAVSYLLRVHSEREFLGVCKMTHENNESKAKWEERQKEVERIKKENQKRNSNGMEKV